MNSKDTREASRCRFVDALIAKQESGDPLAFFHTDKTLPRLTAIKEWNVIAPASRTSSSC